MALDPRLLEILACPNDQGPLIYFAAEAMLYNPRLRKKYRVEDGVPQMLVDDASDASETEHQALLAKAEAERLPLNFTPP
jgi:uncharacterized protein